MRVKKKMPYYVFGMAAIVVVALFGSVQYMELKVTVIEAAVKLPKELREPFTLGDAWGTVQSMGMSLLLPIAAAIPSASYIYEEITGRFYMDVELRKGKNRYAYSHFLYAVLSGGAVVAAGLLAYAFLAGCIFPASVEVDGMALGASLQETVTGRILPDFLYLDVYGMAMSALAAMLVFLYPKLYFDLSILFVMAHMMLNVTWQIIGGQDILCPAAILAALAVLYGPVWKIKSRHM